MPLNTNIMIEQWKALVADNTKKTHSAMPVTREENFPQWYQEVIKAADLAEVSKVKGCMVIKPDGYAIWEVIQRTFDPMLKQAGVKNAAFPLFIPLEFFQKEAEHAEGFATEVAVVTHRKLEKDAGGKLVPTSPLEEPLIVRPTSEMIIGDSMSRWIQSHRDLPLKLNQWCSVVRMEMRPRMFLRSTEFWWHEGHSAHASAEEAQEHAAEMHRLYQRFATDILALGFIAGEKSFNDRFAGAERTYTIEAIMQDGKALQAATSHYLGQNFAKAMDIEFQDDGGSRSHAFTTSWGMSTRMIGALIMSHADDDGLRLPPRVAPVHILILPVIPKEEMREPVLQYARAVKEAVSQIKYHGQSINVEVDDRDIRGGEKSWDAIKKGYPVRIEIGPREVESAELVVSRRDYSHNQKIKVPLAVLCDNIAGVLEDIQSSLLLESQERLRGSIVEDVKDFSEFRSYFSDEVRNPGWVRARWCESAESLEYLKETRATIRCIPYDQKKEQGSCVLTGKPTSLEVIFARAY